MNRLYSDMMGKNSISVGPVGYNVRKAAQVVAFLILKQGGRADMNKTVKLAYLSDRQFLEFYGRPILNDDLYCLDDGPIDLMTFDYITGHATSSVWAQHVLPVDQTTHQISLANKEIYFGELNAAEEEVLTETVKQFADVGPVALVDWIDNNCREWISPRGTSTYLSYEDVFKALGKKHPSKMGKHVVKVRRLAEAISAGA